MATADRALARGERAAPATRRRAETPRALLLADQVSRIDFTVGVIERVVAAQWTRAVRGTAIALRRGVLVRRCAWHLRYHGYHFVLGIASWGGPGVRFTDGMCRGCAGRLHRTLSAPPGSQPRRAAVLASPLPVPPVAVGMIVLACVLFAARTLHHVPPPPPAAADEDVDPSAPVAVREPAITASVTRPATRSPRSATSLFPGEVSAHRPKPARGNRRSEDSAVVSRGVPVLTVRATGTDPETQAP
jgi:hypothetical protein